MVAEVLALRTILLNLHYAHFAGEEVTSERMQQLIARANRQSVCASRPRASLRQPPGGGQ